jgi:hypothetical protein
MTGPRLIMTGGAHLSYVEPITFVSFLTRERLDEGDGVYRDMTLQVAAGPRWRLAGQWPDAGERRRGGSRAAPPWGTRWSEVLVAQAGDTWVWMTDSFP